MNDLNEGDETNIVDLILKPTPRQRQQDSQTGRVTD
jgi:hypothetical protein